MSWQTKNLQLNETHFIESLKEECVQGLAKDTSKIFFMTFNSSTREKKLKFAIIIQYLKHYLRKTHSFKTIFTLFHAAPDFVPHFVIMNVFWKSPTYDHHHSKLSNIVSNVQPCTTSLLIEIYSQNDINRLKATRYNWEIW